MQMDICEWLYAFFFFDRNEWNSSSNYTRQLYIKEIQEKITMLFIYGEKEHIDNWVNDVHQEMWFFFFTYVSFI